MIDILGLLVSGIIVFLFFAWLKSKILNETTGHLAENFDYAKFLHGMFKVFDPVLWAKDFAHLFNIRKITIYLTVVSIVLSIGYWKGRTDKPVQLPLDRDVNIFLNNDEILHITQEGAMYVEDTKGNVKKAIKVKDIPELKKKLKPFGLILEPVFVAGIGYDTTESEFNKEIGTGVSFLKWYKWRSEAFLTNKGGYVGVSYRIRPKGNAHVGMAIGKGYDGDDRVMGYVRFKW